LRGTATLDFNPEGIRFAVRAPAAYVLPIVKGVTAIAMHRVSEKPAPASAQHRVRQRITA
jgi:hypothetical protein